MEKQVSESQKLLQMIQKLVREDTSLFLTLLYLLLIVIGLLFSSFYYIGFQINIFEFADLSDFLLAPIAQPLVLVFSVISLFLAYQAIRFTEYMDKKFPRYATWWNMGFKVGTPEYLRYWRLSAVGAFISYLVIAAYFFGVYRSEMIFKSEDRKIVLEPAGNGTEASLRQVYFLGKTASWIFISEGKGKPIECLPIEGGLFRIYWKAPSGKRLSL